MRPSLRLMIWFLTIMPFSFFYGISTFVYFIMYYILGYRKEVVCKNLRNAFPEKSKAELKYIKREFYKHLADYLVEAVANFHMKISDFDARYKLTNTEILDKYASEGVNVILAPGHYGNWEWVSYLVLKINFTCVAIYKEQSNKFVDDLILHSRGKYGLLLHQYHDAYKYLLRNEEKAPICLYFAADQRPAKKAKVPWVNFLNQPTAAFRGLDSLHRKTKGVVLYVHNRKVKRGFYEVEFRPLNKPGEVDMVPDLTTRYFKALEDNIKEDPRFYLWSHNRWKFSPSPEVTEPNDC
ncbi:lysophospholipid acyltransferase family protein [Bacteroidota bacterium]